MCQNVWPEFRMLRLVAKLHDCVPELTCWYTCQDEDIGTIPQKQRALEATVQEAQTKLALVKQLQPLWLRCALYPVISECHQTVSFQTSLHAGTMHHLTCSVSVLTKCHQTQSSVPFALCCPAAHLLNGLQSNCSIRAECSRLDACNPHLHLPRPLVHFPKHAQNQQALLSRLRCGHSCSLLGSVFGVAVALLLSGAREGGCARASEPVLSCCAGCSP